MIPHAIWWPLASSIQWSFRLFYLLSILLHFLLWSLRLLYMLNIHLTTPIVLLILFMMSTVLLLTLFIWFAEPRVGKARVKRLEEDARSHKIGRHIYSRLAQTAAITQTLSW